MWGRRAAPPLQGIVSAGNAAVLCQELQPGGRVACLHEVAKQQHRVVGNPALVCNRSRRRGSTRDQCCSNRPAATKPSCWQVGQMRKPEWEARAARAPRRWYAARAMSSAARAVVTRFLLIPVLACGQGRAQRAGMRWTDVS
jgi:hypothetical protein